MAAYPCAFRLRQGLQPTMIQVGTASSPSSVACDAYFYYAGFSNPSSCPSTAPGSGTGNNGNAQGWYHWDNDPWNPGTGVINTTTYQYDGVNRLHNVTMASHYGQTFNYDQYGNMVCAVGSNYCNTAITFDTTTNRINSSGYSYDAAGNLTQDGTGTGTHSFQWDGESRMKSVDSGATGTFVYNALGQRVQKTFGGTSVYYYYDGFGNLAMTQNGSAQQLEQYIPGAGAKYVWTGTAWEIHYLHGNSLGSTQIVTRADNSYEEARNFYAFGGLRWQGGGSADVRFASMQKRDSETVGWQDPLDWTPNRLY